MCTNAILSVNYAPEVVKLPGNAGRPVDDAAIDEDDELCVDVLDVSLLLDFDPVLDVCDAVLDEAERLELMLELDDEVKVTPAGTVSAGAVGLDATDARAVSASERISVAGS